MSEKQFSPDPVLNDLFADTARRIHEESGETIEPTVTIEPPPPPPPFSVPVKSRTPGVEVAPGIMVSEHLIRAAVEATSTGDTPMDHHTYYQNLKKREKQLHEEVRQDIDASRKVVAAMVERMKNPPDPKEKYISFDAMPKPLQRVVQAYSAATEANRELEEALAELKQSTTPTTA